MQSAAGTVAQLRHVLEGSRKDWQAAEVSDDGDGDDVGAVSVVANSVEPVEGAA